jgi:antitoxin YefM
MATETSYTRARQSLAALCAQVASTREPVIIHRRGAADVALIAADELRSLEETAHLLRSPRNAARLLKALDRARRGKGRARSVPSLRRELELAAKG